MKKIIILVLAVFAINCAFAQKESSYEIHGCYNKYKKGDKLFKKTISEIYIHRKDINTHNSIDSAKVDENGNYVFSGQIKCDTGFIFSPYLYNNNKLISSVQSFNVFIDIDNPIIDICNNRSEMQLLYDSLMAITRDSLWSYLDNEKFADNLFSQIKSISEKYRIVKNLICKELLKNYEDSYTNMDCNFDKLLYSYEKTCQIVTDNEIHKRKQNLEYIASHIKIGNTLSNIHYLTTGEKTNLNKKQFTLIVVWDLKFLDFLHYILQEIPISSAQAIGQIFKNSFSVPHRDLSFYNLFSLNSYELSSMDSIPLSQVIHDDYKWFAKKAKRLGTVIDNVDGEKITGCAFNGTILLDANNTIIARGLWGEELKNKIQEIFQK